VAGPDATFDPPLPRVRKRAECDCTELGEENRKGWRAMKVAILDDYFDTLLKMDNVI
jgi:hypothetical protein